MNVKHDLACAIRYLNFVNKAHEEDGVQVSDECASILRKLSDPGFLPTLKEVRTAFKLAPHQSDAVSSAALRLPERVALLQAMESSGAKLPPGMAPPPLLPEEKSFLRSKFYVYVFAEFVFCPAGMCLVMRRKQMHLRMNLIQIPRMR